MPLVDLSAPICADPPEVPHLLRTEIDYEDHAAGAEAIDALFGVGQELLRDGEGWAVDTFTRLGTHSSTHVDAPWHYNSTIGGKRAATIDELPLDWFYAPGLVVDATDRDDGEALTYVGFFLNLFNLLPVLPLDGGRAMAALSPWVWFAGYAGLVALTFIFPNPILILILLIGGYESWQRWKRRNTPEGRAFHAIPARTRALVAIVYLGLAAALAVGVSESFLEKSFDDV